MSNRTSIAQMLQTYMLTHRYSTADMAKITGLSVNSIKRVRAASKYPSWLTYAVVAYTVGVDKRIAQKLEKRTNRVNGYKERMKQNLLNAKNISQRTIKEEMAFTKSDRDLVQPLLAVSVALFIVSCAILVLVSFRL